MAVTLDPAEFQKIQEAFRDVALRAERLQELVGLVEHFRALDTSFGLFNRTAKSATSADFPRLDDLWTPCRDFDLTRLVDWIKDMRYVRQQLAGEPEKGRSAEVDGWSADLEQLKEKLQKSMDDQAISRSRLSPTVFSRRCENTRTASRTSPTARYGICAISPRD